MERVVAAGQRVWWQQKGPFKGEHGGRKGSAMAARRVPQWQEGEGSDGGMEKAATVAQQVM